MGFGMGGNAFSIVPVLVIVIFSIVIVMFIVIAVRGVQQWSRNNQSPVLTVQARVVTKRTAVHVSHHHSGDNMAMNHTSSSTSYYATFEVDSGDRMEFRIASREYGMLVEGDSGKLTFQGTRYLSFARS